ncbi:hypothetical protein [Rhodopila globiformis]|nr:hypothetical protein [Rhodopila globiformis]
MIVGFGAVLLLWGGTGLADDPNAQIGNGPKVEKSITPPSAPAASRTQATGATNQSHKVKKMNKKAKAKIETEGK